MLKIDKNFANILTPDKGFGLITPMGAVVGDQEFILYYPEGEENQPYLAHISEFEQKGIFINPK